MCKSSSRVPSEILGKIFLENALPHYPKHRGSRYPPMAVSRSWRNAALSHHQLWIRVEIKTYSEIVHSSPDTLQNWLSRSKPCLLEVVLHFDRAEKDYRKPGQKATATFQSVMEVLFAQAFRWGTLDVLARIWYHSHIFQVLDRAHQLQDLSIQDSVWTEESRGPETVYDSWGVTGVPGILLPSLTRLSITLETLSIDAFPFFVLPSLTELAFSRFLIDPANLVMMMKGIPRLAVLRFGKESGLSGAGLPDVGMGAFDGLETLVLRNSFDGYSPLTLLAEHCPNLHAVTLYSYSIKELPRPPINSLTELTLIMENDDEWDNNQFSSSDIRNAMKFYPRLKNLSLKWQPDSDASTAVSFDPFIIALTPRADGRLGVLSKLEHLTLQDAVLNMSSLLKMVQARECIFSKTPGNDRSFHLTLEGCYGLPNIVSGSYVEVQRLFADPPRINMTFGSSQGTHWY